MKFCCFFSSYNNYILFDKLWFKENQSNLDDILIFNIDCGSDEENLKYKRALLGPLNIIDLKVEEDKRSSQKHIEAIDEYLTKNNIDCDWIVSFQHDCYPTQKDFWKLFEQKLSSLDNYKDKIGVAGFKILNIPQNTNPRQDSFGRGNILNGITTGRHFGWYKDMPYDYEKANHFVVESAAWVAVAINRKLFKQHIVPDHDFYLNLWADDISHQFNIKNIATITFPDLIMNHDSKAKNLMGIPNSPDRSSFHSSKDNKAFNHHFYWKNKYGWRWGMRDGPGGEIRDPRVEFEKVKNRYVGTINEYIFNRNVSDGPISIQEMTQDIK